MGTLLALWLALQEGGAGHRPEEIEQVRTRTAYVLEAGEVEVDAVLWFLRFSEDGRRLDESRLLVEVEVGVTDWLMAEIEVPYVFLNPRHGPGERGWGDVELELKAAIPGRFLGIEWGAGADVSFLTGDEDRGLGGETTELGFFAAASRSFDGWAVHVQGGAEVARGERPEYVFNVAVDAHPWGREFSLLLALNGEIEPGEAPGWALVPGFEVRFEEFQFGAGFPIGLTEEAAAWGVLVDVEVEF